MPANIVASICLRSLKSCLVFAMAVLDDYFKKAQEQDLKAVCLDMSSLPKLIVQSFTFGSAHIEFNHPTVFDFIVLKLE